MNNIDYRTTFLDRPADYLIDNITTELKKLLDAGIPNWTNRQNRDLDNHLSGIVTRKDKNAINTVEKLYDFINNKSRQLQDKYAKSEITTTSIHKFINYWSEKAFVELCCEHNRVTREQNKKNKNVDIWIDGEYPFDIKVTVWPKSLAPGELNLNECLNRANTNKVICWYYKHQGYHRWNWQNRIFIVCYDADTGNHLSLKADISKMRQIILDYFEIFNIENIYKISQEKVNGYIRHNDNRGNPIQSIALADIIWNYKEKPFLSSYRPIDSVIDAEQLILFA